MLGSTSPSSIWGQFFVGYYSSEVLSDPVFLDLVGVPGTVGPTGINGQENLLGVDFSRTYKNLV